MLRKLGLQTCAFALLVACTLGVGSPEVATPFSKTPG